MGELGLQLLDGFALDGWATSSDREDTHRIGLPVTDRLQRARCGTALLVELHNTVALRIANTVRKHRSPRDVLRGRAQLKPGETLAVLGRMVTPHVLVAYIAVTPAV